MFILNSRAEGAPGPDLFVHKAASTDLIQQGQNFTYHIQISNFGDQEAAGVVLEDFLPSPLTMNSVTTSQGSCSFEEATRRVTCDLGTLPSFFDLNFPGLPFADVAISVTASGISNETELTNTVSVNATNESVDNTANNTSSVVTPVFVCRPNPFKFRKVVTRGDPVPGVVGETFSNKFLALASSIFSVLGATGSGFDLNDQGDVAFWGSWGFKTLSPGVVVPRGEGVFVSLGGTLHKVAVTGEETPLGGTFTRFSSAMSQVVLNNARVHGALANARDVVFSAEVAGGSALGGIFLYQVDETGAVTNQHTVVTAGAELPDGQLFLEFPNILLDVNDRRDIAFRMPTPASRSLGGIYRYTLSDEGALLRRDIVFSGVPSLVETNDGALRERWPLPSPFTSDDFAFELTGSPFLNAAGQVTFGIIIGRPGSFPGFSPGQQASAILLWEGGTLHTVVSGELKEAQPIAYPIPGMGIPFKEVFAPTGLNNQGEVVFYGYGEETISQGALVRGGPGGIEAVVTTGDPTPLGGSFSFPVNSSVKPFGPASLNDTREVVVTARVSGGEFDGKDGLFHFFGPNEDPQVVVAEGDCAPIGATFSSFGEPTTGLMWPLLNNPHPSSQPAIAFAAGIGFPIDVVTSTGIFATTQEQPTCQAHIQGPDPVKVDSRGRTLADQPASNIRVSPSINVPVHKQEEARFEAWVTDPEGKKSGAVDLFLNGEKIETETSTDKVFFSFKQINELLGEEAGEEELKTPIVDFTVEVRSQSDPECKTVKRIPIQYVCPDMRARAAMEERYVENFIRELIKRSGVDMKLAKDDHLRITFNGRPFFVELDPNRPVKSILEVYRRILNEKGETVAQEAMRGLLEETTRNEASFIQEAFRTVRELSAGADQKVLREALTVFSWALTEGIADWGSISLEGSTTHPSFLNLAKSLSDGVVEDIARGMLEALSPLSERSPATRQFQEEVKVYRQILSALGLIPLPALQGPVEIAQLVLHLIEIGGGVVIDQTWREYVIKGEERNLVLDAQSVKLMYQSLIHLRNDLERIQSSKELILCEEDCEFIMAQVEAVLHQMKVASADAQRIFLSRVEWPVYHFTLSEGEKVHGTDLPQAPLMFDPVDFKNGQYWNGREFVPIRILRLEPFSEALQVKKILESGLRKGDFVWVNLDPATHLRMWVEGVDPHAANEKKGLVAAINLVAAAEPDPEAELRAFARNFTLATMPWEMPDLFEDIGDRRLSSEDLANQIRELLRHCRP